jgi:tetratricopeptide (TPR) repeat protein
LVGADPAVIAAIESAQAAVRRVPQAADAWGRLGMVLAAHSFYPESIVCFAEAQRLDPGEPRWPYFQGAMLTLSDRDAALIPLRRAVGLCEPRILAPRLRLADVLLGQGQVHEADELYREVLAREPENPQAHLGLGRLAYQRNDWPGSLTHLDQAIQSPLTRKAAHTLLAEVHQRRGDRAAAERQQRLAGDLPEKQIRLDLDRATAEGLAVAPPPSGVVGRDGKRRRVPSRAELAGAAAAPPPQLAGASGGTELAPVVQAIDPVL